MERSKVIAPRLAAAAIPRRRANSPDTTMAAAAPHVGGQALSRVMAPGMTSGDARTSSAVSTLRSRASGLFAPCRLAFARTSANVASVVPYFRMYARPAPPK